MMFEHTVLPGATLSMSSTSQFKLSLLLSIISVMALPFSGISSLWFSTSLAAFFFFFFFLGSFFWACSNNSFSSCFFS
uniref:Uncharacterized protein n=1 Tax=Panstrongylus lignarius TaxID=156445 RepID=A0A224Y4S6_9HEMI